MLKHSLRPLALALSAALLLLHSGACSSGQGRTTKDIEVDLPPNRLPEALAEIRKGEAALNRGDLSAARQHFVAATQISPDTPAVAWNNLGWLHLQENEYLEALSKFQTAAQLAPLDPVPQTNVGNTYHEAGYERQALDAYLVALEREPNHLDAIRGAFRSSRRLNLMDEDALARLNHALLIETDEQWRFIMQQEKIRVENQLDEDNGLG